MKNANEKNEKNEKNTLKDLFNKSPKNRYYKTVVNCKTGRRGIKLEKNTGAYEKLCDFILNNENIQKYGITEYYIEAAKKLKHTNKNIYNIDGVEKITITYYYTTIYEDMLEYDAFKNILDSYI